MKEVIIYKNEIFGKKYDRIEDLVSFADQIAFKGYRGEKTFLVIDTVEYDMSEYDELSELRVLNDHLVFIKRTEDKSWLISGEEEIGSFDTAYLIYGPEFKALKDRVLFTGVIDGKASLFSLR